MAGHKVKSLYKSVQRKLWTHYVHQDTQSCVVQSRKTHGTQCVIYAASKVINFSLWLLKTTEPIFLNLYPYPLHILYLTYKIWKKLLWNMCSWKLYNFHLFFFQNQKNMDIASKLRPIRTYPKNWRKLCTIVHNIVKLKWIVQIRAKLMDRSIIQVS